MPKTPKKSEEDDSFSPGNDEEITDVGEPDDDEDDIDDEVDFDDGSLDDNEEEF